MIKNLSIILMMALCLLSCSHDLKFENPFDLSFDPYLWSPSNLIITPITYNQIKLTWTKSTYNVEGYKISRKIGNGIWQEDIATVNANTNEWIDEDAPYGTIYTYKIKAYAGTNVSQSIEQNQNFVLSAPTNLTISPQSATSIKLSWQDSNLFEQGFKISRKVGTGTWQEDIATVNANVLEWIDTNAPYCVSYSYKVKAYAGPNVSQSIEQNQNFLLSAPTNLTITPQSATSIKLSWRDSNQFEQGFKISRKVANGIWEEDIATVNTNVLEWTDTNAPYGTSYSYKVKAYAGTNVSQPIEQTQNFVLSAPSNLAIIPQSATSIKLTWHDNNQFEQGFKISRKIGSGAWEEDIATVNANVLEWIDSAVNSTQFFEYKIRAYFQNYQSDYSNTVIFDMSRFVYVQGGTFQMGSSSGDSDEEPIHSVTLSSFYIGRYEVTQGEWQSVMTGNANGISATPSYFSGNSTRPVEGVSWYDIMVYCNRRSIQEGLTPCYAKGGITNPNNWGTVPTSTNVEWDAITCNWSANGYRLPTEAEWEFAAKGGNQSQGYTYSGSNIIGNVAWYSSNSGSTTHPAGTKAPNELGIYDMSGNVWEWCWDWYGSYSSSAQTNPHGATSGSRRVYRGGSWSNGGGYCRVANRDGDKP